MCSARRKGEKDSKEGVLEKHGLPNFAPELLFKVGRVWNHDVGVAVEAHGVSLSDKNTSEGPAVRGVIVVDKEVGYEDHGLHATATWFVEVGTHS